MSKSIKLQDNTYWDSDGISYDKRTLKAMIESQETTEDVNLPTTKIERHCNFNELPNKGTGLFIAWATCTNAPAHDGSSTVHWYVIQIVYQVESYVVQIATCLHSDTRLYIRHNIKGS